MSRAERPKSAHRRRPGFGPHRREHPRHGAADPSVHNLRARSRQSLSQRQRLRASRQRDGARGGGGRSGRSRARRATLVYGSGMSAAIALFLELRAGRSCGRAKGMYWALRAWLAGEAPAFGISVDFVDAEDLQALARAVKPGETRLVWLETPSNPLWGVSDIEGRRAHRPRGGRGSGGRFDLRDADPHPAACPRRRRRRCTRRPNTSTAIPT